MSDRINTAAELMTRIEQNLRTVGFSEQEIAELRARAEAIASEQLSAGVILVDKCPACGGDVAGLLPMPYRTREDRTIHQVTSCGHAVLIAFEALEGGQPGRHVVLSRP